MAMSSNRLGYCILAGLVAIAVSIPVAVNKIVSASHSVAVRGLCEKEVKADRVIWPIVVTENGNLIPELAKSAEKSTNAVVQWLKDAGVNAEDISVSAPKIEDLTTYSTNRAYNYALKSVVTVCSSDVDKVMALQASQFELLNKGIAIGANNWEYQTVYSFNGLNEIKPQMIEDATKNARAAAEKFAKDSGSKVGKIISASQGQFSINDRDSNTPHIKIVRVVTSINYQLF